MESGGTFIASLGSYTTVGLDPLTAVEVLDCPCSGNEEPGTMMPGHCFTIEVDRSSVI